MKVSPSFYVCFIDTDFLKAIFRSVMFSQKRCHLPATIAALCKEVNL